MFEGIGIQTVLGILTTVGIGVTTPADCYVGLGAHDPGSTFDIDNPMWSAVTNYTQTITTAPVNKIYQKTTTENKSPENPPKTSPETSKTV